MASAYTAMKRTYDAPRQTAEDYFQRHNPITT